MVNRLWHLFIAVMIVVGFSTVSPAMVLQEYTPLLSHFEIKTTEEVVLIFDDSVDPGTLSSATVYLETRDSQELIPGALSLQTTYQSNDTVVFTPTNKLPFGIPIRIVVTTGLADITGSAFDGVFPEGDWFTANVPTDLERPVWDPSNFTAVFVNSNVLLGFNPLDPESTNVNEPWTIPGISATEAWKIHTGTPEIIIASLDTGFSSLDDPDIINRLFLNIGELPAPLQDGQPCANNDCNGDGRFNAADYNGDSRVVPATPGMVSPMDLIETFSDGVDDDQNGYVDDISGYDFFRNTNTAIGVSEFPEGTHANLTGKAAVSQAGNDSGNKPGVCPNCTLLPLRVTDAVVADLDAITEGAKYAGMMGAKVLVIALGALDYNLESEQAFVDLYEQGVVTVAASGDELGYHHLYPAAGEDVISVHAVMPIPPVELFAGIDLGFAGFTESYCTNYGARITHTVSTGACTSEGVGNGAGLAGLLFSYGKEQGYDLTAGEVMQIMNMSVDDVQDHCITLTKGGCKPGWDQHWGYGRVNAGRAIARIGIPELNIPETIPPDVRITSPKWWLNFDPLESGGLDVEGQISARGRQVRYELQMGKGVEPDDEEFFLIDQGQGTNIDGKLGTINFLDFYTEQGLKLPPFEHDDYTVTIRVQAWYTSAKGEEILGEARKAIAVFSDRDEGTGTMDGFPLNVENSGEGSPVLYDLDGDPDGRPEIVAVTGSGYLNVFKYTTDGQVEMLSGFPVEIPTERTHEDGSIGSPAVGSLFGDGVPIIVFATLHGKVYAVWPDGNNHEGGPFVEGFPVSAFPLDNSTPLSYGHGNAFFASPVLADLNKDGFLEIIAASHDQNVYVWTPFDDDNDGSADFLPGWPVSAKSSPGQVPADLVCDNQVTAQILATPAVAVLDPHHEDPEVSDYLSVVISTAEVCGQEPDSKGRIYAIYHNGYDHPDGPFLPGWPAAIAAPVGDELPIPPVTIGATTCPAIYWDEFGDRAIIGIGAFASFPAVLEYQDNVVEEYQLQANFSLAASTNGSFGRLDDSGIPYYIFPTLGFLNQEAGVRKVESFNVLAWRVGEWNHLRFRRRLDDIHFFSNPTVGDITGDGKAEILSGSSGYMVRAWDIDNNVPEDWPKFTQHFHIGSPVMGDLNADGKKDILTYTHEGYLFAWNTKAYTCGNDGIGSDWWSFSHDEWNTGTFGFDTIPPSIPQDFKVYTTDEEDVFSIWFKSPGDDWMCGTALEYELRYSTDANADLRDPEVFEAASLLSTPDPKIGGSIVRFDVTAPDAKVFAMRSMDDQGLLSLVGPMATPQEPGTDDDDDDDTADDDDDDSYSGGDDDDDDEGCCG